MKAVIVQRNLITNSVCYAQRVVERKSLLADITVRRHFRLSAVIRKRSNLNIISLDVDNRIEYNIRQSLHIRQITVIDGEMLSSRGGSIGRVRW